MPLQLCFSFPEHTVVYCKLFSSYLFSLFPSSAHRPTGEEYEPFEVTKDVPTKVSPPKGRSGGKKVAALNEYERL